MRKTFCSTNGTPYYRLHHRRSTFDEVTSLSVEGNKSAIARVKRVAWNTVHRWLERAAGCCRRFSHRKFKGLSISELQADEIRTTTIDDGSTDLSRTAVKKLPCLRESRTVWISRSPNLQEFLVPFFSCLVVSQSLRGPRQPEDILGKIRRPQQSFLKVGQRFSGAAEFE